MPRKTRKRTRPHVRGRSFEFRRDSLNRCVVRPELTGQQRPQTGLISRHALRTEGRRRRQKSKHVGSVPPNGCIFRVNGIVQDGDRMFGTTVWCEEESSIGVSATASAFERANVTISASATRTRIDSVRPPVYTRYVTREGWRLLCACVLAGLGLAPLAAHHVISAKFDSAKQVTLRGPISAVDWANPHAHVFINVADGNGRIANWAIELESPVDLRRQGWTANTVSIGDVVTVEGIAARDGSKQAWSLSMVLAGTGQRVFFARPIAEPARTDKPTPRWPDGQPRLGSLPGETGY